jgi:PIN domain nuclease of toxin-antitoxin system
MNSVVLDSSVLLAIINKEEGYEKAIFLLADSIISSVTYGEILGILISRYYLPQAQVINMIKQLVSTIISFNESQAVIVAELEVINSRHKYGLSLADKSCIALGINLKLPIYTADRIWAKVDYANADINLIR